MRNYAKMGVGPPVRVLTCITMCMAFKGRRPPWNEKI
jgi:hypothetical protein